MQFIYFLFKEHLKRDIINALLIPIPYLFVSSRYKWETVGYFGELSQFKSGADRINVSRSKIVPKTGQIWT